MRREFSKAVRVEIIKRATHDGKVWCEGCGCITKRFEIDHCIADGLRIDKSKHLTAFDGELLCKDAGRDSCHGRKTAEQDIPAIARAKRLEATHIGAKPAPKAKIASRPRIEKPKRDVLPIPERRPLYCDTAEQAK